MPDVPITWLGHAAFRFDTPAGKRVYVDPFLDGPTCPEGEKQPERVDLIVLTHGHDDHVGSTVELAQKFECPVVAQVELRGWLSTKGLPETMEHALNKGGTQEVDGLKITLTNAHHSSSGFENGQFVYLGESCGLVIEAENGTKLYFAGDTCVFGDMQLIGRIYEPDVAILPIGDHFTMGPREAAVALELLGVKRCIPSHYGTFPVLTGTRWFGSTGRRVPQIAVEGEVDLDGALVLDELDDGALRAAFEEGTPVVVRADSAEGVVEALRRPEVSTVLVSPDRRDLVDLDLVELTYGS